jgi:hypothetical protein
MTVGQIEQSLAYGIDSHHRSARDRVIVDLN